jgi:hypothetical protein
VRRAGPWVAIFAAACGASFDKASLVDGLRVLAIKSEPAEVAPGRSATLSVLAVDTTGRTVTLSWSACTAPAQLGLGDVNPDCFNRPTAAWLLPLGTGTPLSASIPAIDPQIFAPPDSSGGLYLPLRLDAQAGADKVSAAYRLRLALGGTPNQNPKLADLQVVPASGAPVSLDEATPLEVHSGGKVTLRAIFAAGSAETYQVVEPGQSKAVTELLNVSWYATAGSWSEQITGQAKPDTVWTADIHLPPAGSRIDVWIVGRDERGGTDFLHRAFVLR